MSRQDNVICQCKLWVVFRIRVLRHLTCHSARRACPELQNPLFQLTKEHLLPGEKVRARADEWWGKVFFLALTHRLRRSPLSRRTRVMLDDGFCDSALGSAQNDRVVNYCEE